MSDHGDLLQRIGSFGEIDWEKEKIICCCFHPKLISLSPCDQHFQRCWDESSVGENLWVSRELRWIFSVLVGMEGDLKINFSFTHSGRGFLCSLSVKYADFLGSKWDQPIPLPSFPSTCVRTHAYTHTHTGTKDDTHSILPLRLGSMVKDLTKEEEM